MQVQMVHFISVLLHLSIKTQKHLQSFCLFVCLVGFFCNTFRITSWAGIFSNDDERNGKVIWEF